MESQLRNKNAGRTKYDYDLNIFIPEELDEDDQSYWDPSNWHIHVYSVEGNGHREVDEAFRLNSDDIIKLGLNRDEYFRDEVDVWYGYEGFMKDYWDKMTDRIKEYLESFPKYKA